MSSHEAFVIDTDGESRRRAQRLLPKGAFAQINGGKKDAAAILDQEVTTQFVCVLRYKNHAVCATGFTSDAIKRAYAQSAQQGEGDPGDLVTELIEQLQRQMNLSPEGLVSRAASEKEGEYPTAMLIKNLFADRIVVELYREMLRYFRERDTGTEYGEPSRAIHAASPRRST